MAKIDALFKLMNEQGASDLHLISGSQPIFRIHGDMERVDHKSLENDELKDMLYEIAPENKKKLFRSQTKIFEKKLFFKKKKIIFLKKIQIN